MEDVLHQIHSAGLRVLSSKSLIESYEIIVKEYLPIFEGFEGSILLYKKRKLERVYSTTAQFNLVKFGEDNIRFKSFEKKLPVVLTKPEMDAEEKEFPVLKKQGVKSIIFVPIAFANKPLGLFIVWSKKERPKIKKNPELIKVLGMLISLYVKGLESSKRWEEDPSRILTDIYDSALKFLEPLPLSKTYETIVNEAIKLVNADDGRLFMEEKGELRNVYDYSKTVSFEPRKKGYVYTAFKKQKAFVISSKDVAKVHPQIKKTSVRSVILIPLSNRGESYGVLTVRSFENKKFTKRELSILRLFGSLASLAIRKTQLYDETKQALETRDLFISMAAHELRTPLTSVIGYFQLLRGKIENKKSVPSKWLEDMDVETKRLKQIAEEFLEINRIRTGKLQYEFKEVRLKKLLIRSIAAFKFSRPDRKINFIDGSVQNDKIIGDRDKLIQVITNILENAVKYSSPETDVNVSLKNGGRDFVVEIGDKGHGISKEDMPQIFRGFYKGKNSQHEGMGLGLYLAKNIVEDHHGSIEIESELEKGTKVKISLPKPKYELS